MSGSVSNLLGESAPPVVTLKIDTNTTSIDISEGSAIVLILALSSSRSLPTPAVVKIASSRNDVDDVFTGGASISTTINAGSSSGAAIISTIRDVRYTGDRSFTLSLSSADPSVVATPFELQVNVKDLENPPVFSIPLASQNVNEGAGTATVTVEMSPAAAMALSVPYLFSAGTATSSDHAAVDGALIFAPGETSKTISFNVTDDSDVELTETLSVSLGAPIGPATVDVSNDDQTINVVDNDQPTISIANVTATEGNTLTFTVNLSPSSPSVASVDFATADNTALAGSHYTTSSGTVNFAVGETTKTVVINTTANASEICATDRTFNLNLSNASGATIGITSAVGTITDPDRPILSIANANANEGSNVQFTASLSTACPIADVTFNYATSIEASDSTTTSDFGTTNSAGTITAGTLSTLVSVPTVEDGDSENPETFTVTLSSPSEAALHSTAFKAVGTIIDNDAPFVQLATSSSSFSEVGGRKYGAWPTSMAGWTKRMKLNVQNQGITGTLTDFPVLVRLDSSRINYADFKSNGEDVRFVDSSGNTLSHEIASWNSSGTSEIWVNVPSIAANSSSTYFMMYFGNGSATSTSAASAWNTNYKAVWHLGGNYSDSTSNGNNGTMTGTVTTASGLMGNSSQFNGTSNINFGQNASIASSFTGDATWEFWVKAGALGSVVNIANQPSRFILSRPSTDRPFWAEIPLGFANLVSLPSSGVDTGEWTHVVSVRSGAVLKTYINGIEQQSRTGNAGSLTTATGSFYLGSSNTATNGWVGLIDEARISSAAHSAAWIRAQYLNGIDSYLSFGAVESNSQGRISLNVSLSQAAASIVTVPYTISGTADATNTDAVDGTLTFPVGVTSQSLDFYVIKNELTDPDKTVVVTLGTPTSAVLGSPTVHTLTIQEPSNTAPIVSNIALEVLPGADSNLWLLNGTTDAENDRLFISAVSSPTNATITMLDQHIRFTPNVGWTGTETLNFTVSDARGLTTSRTATITVRSPYNWIGAIDSDPSKAGNWHGGVVPPVGAAVYFNNEFSTNRNVTLASNYNWHSANLSNDFTGTITQNADLRLGRGLFMNGGTWEQNALLTPALFIQNAGTFKLNSTNTLRMRTYASLGTPTSVMSIPSASSFVASPTSTIDLSPGGSFCNDVNQYYDWPDGLSIGRFYTNNTGGGCGGNAIFIFNSLRKFIVNGDLDANWNYGGLSGINADVYGNLLIGSVTTDLFNSKVVLKGSANQTINLSPPCTYGAVAPAVEIDKSAGTVTSIADTSKICAAALRVTAGTFTAPSAGVSLSGAADGLPLFYVNPVGTTVNYGTSSWTFGSGYGVTQTIDIPNSHQLGDVTIRHVGGATAYLTVASGKTLSVAGSLTMNAGYTRMMGDWQLAGNIVNNLSSTSHTMGTANIRIVGVGKTYTAAVGSKFASGTVRIADGASLTLNSNLNANTVGQNFFLEGSSTLNLNGYVLNVGNVFTCDSSTINKNTTGNYTTGSFADLACTINP